MLKHFLSLEWKSFFRSAALGTNIIIQIFKVLMALYFIAMFTIMGFAIYPALEDMGLEPMATVNKFLIYYLFFDLVLRYFVQKMPVVNIKPLLILPFNKNTIVHFALGKTLASFFNLIHAFFFIPFSILLVINGFSVGHVLLWHLAIMGLIFMNNSINVLINNKDSVLYPLVIVVIAIGAAQYYKVFDITQYTAVFFQGLYTTYYLFMLPIVAAVALYYFAFKYFKNNLYLDEGLAKKTELAKTENFNWLNQFGTLGTFLKNDIRLLKRNKRARATVMASVFFLFYGLLFLGNMRGANRSEAIQIFAGIFVTGGFMLNFGQFVPSWDSSYYQLMMSQNIQYREYLSSKWWLMVIATLISSLLAAFYLYFGWHTYLLMLTGAVYNIGVNSHIVLLGGAYNKTPIDITVRKAFGDKQAINFTNFIIAIPKIIVPLGLYGLGDYLYNEKTGMLFVLIAGILGFAFRNLVFKQIEKIYKTQKYATIAAYKQNH